MTKIIHEFFIDEYLDIELQRCYVRVNRIESVASVFVDFRFCQRCAFTVDYILLTNDAVSDKKYV